MVGCRPRRTFAQTLALLVLAGGCRASLSEREVRPAAPDGPGGPVTGIWVTYSLGGVISSTEPNEDGTATVTGGGLRPPILSVRLSRRANEALAGKAHCSRDASLLLGLARLPLPEAAYDNSLDELASKRGERANPWDWRLEQIRRHGRPVGLQVDLESTPVSPAASLCRSLDYRELSDLRSDLCTIRGVIDRRDGWPITIGVTRKGERAGGATESHSRNFARMRPEDGLAAREDRCTAAS